MFYDIIDYFKKCNSYKITKSDTLTAIGLGFFTVFAYMVAVFL